MGSKQRPETASNPLLKNLETNLRNYIFSKKVQFSTCTNRVIHPFYPQFFCIIIVCNFSWDMKMSLGKGVFGGGGVKGLYYGICASRESCLT